MVAPETVAASHDDWVIRTLRAIGNENAAKEVLRSRSQADLLGKATIIGEVLQLLDQATANEFPPPRYEASVAQRTRTRTA